jgi:hypothetical protein
MIISRGQAVGSIHWAQLARYEAEAAERELAEAREEIARAEASAKAESSEPHAVGDGPILQPEEFTPEPVIPNPFDGHVKVEVDGVDQGAGQVGVRPNDAHPGEVIEPKPSPIPPKRGPGRPRKDTGH